MTSNSKDIKTGPSPIYAKQVRTNAEDKEIRTRQIEPGWAKLGFNIKMCMNENSC